MKKMLAILIAALMLFGMAACGGSKPDDKANDATGTADTASSDNSVDGKTEDKDKTPAEPGAVSFEIESCRFRDSVSSSDDEHLGASYSTAADKVFVDLVVFVSDAGDKGVTEGNAWGYAKFQDEKYQFQFAGEGATSFIGDADDTIKPHASGRIHLFVSVPESLQNESGVTAVVFIDRVEKTVNVDNDTRTPLEKKTEINAGDKFENVYGTIDIEVFDCRKGPIRTTDPTKSSQYLGDRVDLILNVKNNGSDDFRVDRDAILCYAVPEDSITITQVDREDDEAVYLRGSDTLKPGESAFFHFYCNVENCPDNILRIDFDYNFYYIKVK